MRLSRENVGQTTLDEYVDVVAKIYSRHDKNRTIWDVWCHTLHHAAGVVEQIRNESDREALREEISDFSLWLFTAVLKLQGQIGQSETAGDGPQDSLIRIQKSCSDLLWQKYPKACPSCLTFGNKSQSVDAFESQWPCNCRPGHSGAHDTRRRRIEFAKDYSIRFYSQKPLTINNWQDMFGRIFEANIRRLSLMEMALRLMEELGEASDAMVRMYTYKPVDFTHGEPHWRQLSLESRLADVFAWLFMLVERLSFEQLASADAGRRIYLSQIIWERYGSEELGAFHCSACKATRCKCEIIIVGGTHAITEFLEKLK